MTSFLRKTKVVQQSCQTKACASELGDLLRLLIHGEGFFNGGNGFRSHSRHTACQTKEKHTPHLTLEYTDNLDVDIQPLLARLHEDVVVTGAINRKGIKSRAICHSQYRIADGNPNYAFVHVGLLIRKGRPLEIQKEATRRVIAVLEETFGHHFETRKISLSVDLKEMMEGIALTDHNVTV